MFRVLRTDKQVRGQLLVSLFHAIQIIEDFADSKMFTDHYQWQRSLFGHSFSPIPSSCGENGECTASTVQVLKSWLQAHEEAQVMLASILVVVGLWWMVRAVLSLLINLVCPLLVVVLAVVCIPQLRTPLLGQNYPMLASLLRSILLKMAENIKTQ
ncbi:uncharacterized protein LOC113516453 [Galleria mellonella]|uniref:Uncharacterized protein LOC113516453 n=1 Tax=Galleria mellonella TaxID=7137 RepID=A0A6J1WVQ8_GALME|nr:uncharacterized protein LOC113516453 [Galleria mellonella]